MSQNNKEDIRKILEYWHTIEFLSQENFKPQTTIKPKTQKERMHKEVFLIEEKNLELFYDEIRKRAEYYNMKTWGNITLYIGRIERDKCIEKIRKSMLQNEEEFFESNSTKIAGISLQLSPNGLYIEHSLSLSPIIWAIKQLEIKKSDKTKENMMEILDVEKYESDVKAIENETIKKEKFSSYFEKEAVEAENTKDTDVQNFSPEAVRGEELNELMKFIEAKYIDEYFKSQEGDSAFEKIYEIEMYFYDSERSRSEKEKDDYYGLDRHYYTSDIEMILEKVKDNSLGETEFGKEIEKYILSKSASINANHFDLLSRPTVKTYNDLIHTFSDIINIKNAPIGKWPSRHDLSFMQQVAINLALKKNETNNSKIFSVNGPPGTGKTTLLKEIVVNNVVERAILLSEYENPSDAFIGHNFHDGKYENSNYDKDILNWYSLKNDKINDYGVLVASCNNAAVENITKELPQSMIEELSRSNSRGKEKVAHLFDPDKSGAEEKTHENKLYKDIYFTRYAQNLLDKDGEKVWGLIAAPLGKSSNIGDFYWKVLYHIDKDFYKDGDIENRREKYRSAREEFKKQLKKVQDIKERLSFPQECFKEKIKMKPEWEKAEKFKKQCEEKYSCLIEKRENEIKISTENISMLEGQLNGNDKTLGSLAKKKLPSKRKKLKLIIKIKLQKIDIRNKEKTIKKYNKAMAKELEVCRNTIECYEAICEKYKHSIEHLDESYVSFDEKFLEKFFSDNEDESTEANVLNPGMTEEYNCEREKLFALSMRLNKEFVLSSEECGKNFKILAEYWGMKPIGGERVRFSKRDREEFVPVLFQTLFLLVPAISTTFASVGNMLRDVKGEGSLGTLLIDEAGQAEPQTALGALYRCRNAVIVGDPQQIEPVVNDDLKLLKEGFNNSLLCTYTDKSNSVQLFADQINKYGTFLNKNNTKKEWIGCPLIVHRRCISPMYDISNEISYDNIMRLKTEDPSEEDVKKFIYPETQWINVCGKIEGNKNYFVKNQGEKVCELLKIAFKKDSSPDIYIISPFKSVVDNMAEFIKKNGRKYNIDTKYFDNSKRIGTVHTFQGKEAKEVIFLLGCDQSKESRGAIRWVSSNIVNVAVTRAKYRLYVIGDESAWQNSNCISRMKSIIDTYALKEIKKASESNWPEEEKNKVIEKNLSKLPPSSSFATKGEKSDECILETQNFIKELSKVFNNELSQEELKKFEFQSQKDLDKFSSGIRENLLSGIKLYFLLKPIYMQGNSFDASCCAILFCKALELQIRVCFKETFCEILPKEKDKRGNFEQMTLGETVYFLKSDFVRTALIDKTEATGSPKYNEGWWKMFCEKLNASALNRNKCCHSDKFVWSELENLLDNMFGNLVSDKKDDVQNLNAVKGLIFESNEIGNILNSKLNNDT